MQAKREYRDRDEVEVAVLDALVDRHQEGMTVFELRSHVEADIDEIERALGALKSDGLIDVDKDGRDGERAVIKPVDRVVPEGDESHAESLLDQLRERLPF